jgi:four helix bundle protein
VGANNGYQRTRKDGAVGIDGQTAEEYAAKLDENLQSLLDRAKSGRYLAPPVRRVHIPKGDGRQTRPIGIPTLDVYQTALQLARRVHEAKLQDPELRDQATRASKSAFLNLSEGLPHDQPGLRRRYFTSANGSVHETVAAVDLALALSAVSPEDAAAIQALALRLKRMLRALLSRAA